MQQERICPNSWAFLPVLNACAGLGALEEGRHVHEQILQLGCESDVYVANGLLDMYAKCGSVEDAWTLFKNIQNHNVVTWNAMIGGFVTSGQDLKAMELFWRMQREGLEPNAVTFVGMLKACASSVALEEGRRVHTQIIQSDCETNVYVATCLVDMYAKCRSIEDAWTVFDKMHTHDAASWNAMIWGYVKSGQGLKAVELFKRMQEEGIGPNTVTFVGVLNACASVAALEEGRHVHTQLVHRGCESNVYVANSLVDMYAKCGSLEDAWGVFGKIREHDVISWNAMIGGYVKAGQVAKVMRLYWRMEQEGVEPNAVTFVGVLGACARIGALEEGRHVHAQIIQRGYESDVYVANCLVDMYTKCGCLKDAWTVFNKMKEHDVITWNAMIGGYVKSGHGLKALELFQEMQQEGVEPDAVTFIGVLNACASLAALEEGRCVHRQIIQHDCESYVCVANCLVNMYFKCGSLEDACSMFNKMPEHSVVTLNAMIGGYAMHGQAKKAIGFFKFMGKEGLELDGITFTSILSACSHGGLVKEGLRYFKSMSSCFSILPSLDHYTCMVDLLGRAGQLVEAEELIKRMPLDTDVCVWMSLLGACRVHGNIELAERAAKRCRELDPGGASGDVLLSNMYAAAGKWDKNTAINYQKLERSFDEGPACTLIEVNDGVH